MNKIGYLLLAILNCGLVFGVTLPAGGPLSTDAVFVQVDTFFEDKDVGRCTIDWRNRICSIVDHPCTVTGYGAFGITGVTAMSEIFKQCNVFDVLCIANQLSFNGVVASAVLSLPFFGIIMWNWMLKHESVRHVRNVKHELKKIILDVIATSPGTWDQTQNNLDKFLRFALAQYWSCYRSSSKFERDSFKSALENWKP
jgi:hypothetical protein